MAKQYKVSEQPERRRRKRRKKRERRFEETNQTKLVVACGTFLLCICILIGRLIWINMRKSDTYSRIVLAQMDYDSRNIPFKRGDITDRNGTVLATSEKVYNLVLDPYVVINSNGDCEKPTAEAIEKYFGIDASKVYELLEEDPESRYCVMAKELDYDTVKAYQDFMDSEDEKDMEERAYVKGIWFEEEYLRKYPYDSLAAALIGFTNKGNDGTWGIEGYYNDMLNGRYYYDAHGYLKQLDYDTDKDLIGKVVEFKSPITCASDDGVCKYCYGHLFDTNRSMFSPGVLASLKLTEKLSQAVLSAKHSQTTHSNPISFNDDFNDVFETVSTDITLRDDSNVDDVLYLKLDHVQVEELDDSEFYYVDEFDIINDARKVLYHISENNGAKLYLSEMLVSKYKAYKNKKLTDSCIIALDDIDDEENLFTIEVKNQELTNPIKVFEGILNRKDHMGCKTISELCQKFAESLINLGTTYDLVHMEMIIRSIIRKKSNILEYPDFSAAGNPYDWQIIRLNDAMYYNPSALVSMPYGYLRKQLLSTELYEKSAPSHLDALFISNLSDYLPEEDK